MNPLEINIECGDSFTLFILSLNSVLINHKNFEFHESHTSKVVKAHVRIIAPENVLDTDLSFHQFQTHMVVDLLRVTDPLSSRPSKTHCPYLFVGKTLWKPRQKKV